MLRSIKLSTLVLIGLMGAARADNVVQINSGMVGKPPIAGPATPATRYQAAISRELYDKFGHGAHGRNIYCAGPAVIRFSILPNGRVTHVKLVRQSLPGLDGTLVAKISNLVFPRFEPGMKPRPLVVEYTYGVWKLARPFLAQRSNCR